MTARLVSSVLHVANVERAVRFYGAAFGFRRRFVDELGLYAETDAGTTTLAFTEREFAQRQAVPTQTLAADGPPPPSEIAVAVDDVQTAVDLAVRAGARLERAAETKYWGQTVAYVRDPDGHLVQICTPLNLPGNS